MARPALATCFEHIWLPVGEDGKRQRGVIARCGKCDAAASLPVNTMANGGSQTDEVEWKFIAGKLGMKGWEIGRRARDHRCPRCQRNTKLESGAEVYSFQSKRTGQPMVPGDMQLVKEAFMSTTTPLPPKVITNTPRPGESADARKRDGRDLPGREMSRGDKTAIYDLLKEVYLNETTGYADGWSDHKLAEKLDVPRAWVATIRDEFFGDEITNEVTREKVKAANDLVSHILALKPSIEEAVKLLGVAEKMQKDLAEIAKVMK
jgi:hypothetical protein